MESKKYIVNIVVIKKDKNEKNNSVANNIEAIRDFFYPDRTLNQVRYYLKRKKIILEFYLQNNITIINDIKKTETLEDEEEIKKFLDLRKKHSEKIRVIEYDKKNKRYNHYDKIQYEIEPSERIDLFNIKNITKKAKARPVRSYRQLLDILEAYSMNPEISNKYFTIRLLYNLLGDKNNKRWTKNAEEIINNKKLVDIIAMIKEDANKLQEQYNVNILDEDEPDFVNNLEAFILQETIPFFGASSVERDLVVRNGKRFFTVKFPNTKVKCLLLSVYKSIGKSLTSKDYKNINIKSMTYSEQIKYIEEKENIKINIIQNEDKIAEEIDKAKISKEVVLFGASFHIGYIVEGIEKLETFKKDSEEEEELDEDNIFNNIVKNKDNIIYGTVDLEWEYEDNKPKEPNLICLTYMYRNKLIKQKMDKPIKTLAYIESLADYNITDIYIFAHNARKVENIIFLKHYMIKRNVKKYKLSHSKGNKINSFTIKIDKTTIHFIDSLNYIQGTLDSLSKIFKTSVPKGHIDMKENMTKEEKDNWYKNKKWDINNINDVEYCMNDCIILLEIIEKLNRLIKKIFERLTGIIHVEKNSFLVTKTSISSFIRNIIFYKYPKLLGTSKENDIFKHFYAGGRNEIFFKGNLKGNIYLKDVRSMYPFIMSESLFGRFICEIEHYKEEYINSEHYGKRWCAFMELKYKKEMEIPLLAIKKEGKLLFPNIMNYTVVPIIDSEYNAIKDNLDIKNIIKIYEAEEINFKEEIDILYNFKKNSTGALRQFSKICLNSIYGSLAMASKRNNKLIIKEQEIKKTLLHKIDRYTTFDSFDDYKTVNYTEFCKVPASFITSMGITADARLYLWKGMVKLSGMGYKILYCDTDSIFCIKNENCEDISNFSNIHEEDIGGWDNEIVDEITIHTCKVYNYTKNNKIYWKFKGLSYDNIRKLENNEISQNTRTFINKTNSATSELKITTYDREITFDLDYNKGNVTKSGDVIPLII